MPTFGRDEAGLNSAETSGRAEPGLDGAKTSGGDGVSWGCEGHTACSGCFSDSGKQEPSSSRSCSGDGGPSGSDSGVESLAGRSADAGGWVGLIVSGIPELAEPKSSVSG